MDDNDRQTNDLQPEKEDLKDTEPGQEPIKKTEDMSKENKEEKGKEGEGGGSCCGGNK